ncbi:MULTISPECIES: malonyl-ACP O-methyltransferase BioC [Rahnella]|uniref:malonyl-ACP O-methyltransferase BioC n=1 Tax=Rahnella TaxID=34037 RepID=UPI0006FCBD2E|nr:malonyl-ACP O-methyltransferase BioC [Rahnella rivi]KQN68815.1 malonyl-[acyl-carrier protein] O-methyltransferase BioC [Serratia sp. Leaf51]MBB6113270.1 malonyl-CoA O-methyltransferase [Rahnella inusitata]MBU9832820.1 malonyl-ACP O-methyltransferase BioC [Rahnella rivi]
MGAVTELVNKQAVADAFSRAAISYENAAQLQRDVGEELLSLAAPYLKMYGLDGTGNTVVDAGCGTGYFSRFWKAQGQNVIALDLSEGMLNRARELDSAQQYVPGDIERLPFADNSVDICFSNLAVQWCNALPRALEEMHRVTRNGGLVLFSTLAEGSLNELAAAWMKVDGRRHVNKFLTPDKIAEACAPYRHEVTFSDHIAEFPDVMSLMRSLKGIGATHIKNGRIGGLGGRERLQLLEKHYVRRDGILPLNYRLVYGILQVEELIPR